MTDIIDAHEVSRTFRVRQKTSRYRRTVKTVTAVDSVSFRVRAGEAVGYVGPNGSGKSTTIKMLTGILVPSSGRIRVCGHEPFRRRRQLARHIGLVFGQRSQLWWDLPLRESLEILRAIYRVPPAAYQRRLDECVAYLGLEGFLETPVRQLSLGQRMRGEVTAALLHDPDLLVLDEPTIGLDLDTKVKLREFLRRLVAQQSTTLLLTTHDLQDIESLCPRLILIHRGTVLADDSLRTLRQEVCSERVLLVDLEHPCSSLPPLEGVRSASVENGGTRHRLSFRSPESTAAQLVERIASQVPVHDVSVIEPSIDDVVQRLYSRQTMTVS